MNNTKQVGLGWLMFPIDNQEQLMPNTGSSSFVLNKGADGNTMDWFYHDANTNAMTLVGSDALMATYIKSPGVYKCPSDKTPVANGERVRTVSMCSGVGATSVGSSGTSTYTDTARNRVYVTARKSGDLNSPGPSMIIVTLDEHPDWMDDSIFWFDPGLSKGNEYFREAPGDLHGNAGTLSFADGHSETHKWLNSALQQPVKKLTPAPGHVALAGNDPDYNWFNDRLPYH